MRGMIARRSALALEESAIAQVRSIHRQHIKRNEVRPVASEQQSIE
jgi:hypothetical protein